MCRISSRLKTWNNPSSTLLLLLKVSIFQQITSILMAIIIAHPACCCTFLSPSDTGKNQVSSCCQSPPPSGIENQDDTEQSPTPEPHKCLCANSPTDLPDQHVQISSVPLFILREPIFLATHEIHEPLLPLLVLEQLALPPPPPQRLRFQNFRL